MGVPPPSGNPLGVPPPKVEKIVAEPMCTIMQNFTPIGVTIAEIFVTGQIDTKKI